MRNLLDLLHWRPLRWFLALVWSILLCILLLQPETAPIISLGLPSGPQTLAREAFFTTLHVLAFAMTCSFWYWAWRGHASLRISLTLACLLAIALGSATEFLQSFAPERHPSSIDLIANLFGTILAAWIIYRGSTHFADGEAQMRRYY